MTWRAGPFELVGPPPRSIQQRWHDCNLTMPWQPEQFLGFLLLSPTPSEKVSGGVLDNGSHMD